MFEKVLIANRGEIAVRVAQALHEMGIGVIAVYSDVDRGAPHVGAADEAYPLEGESAGETYLCGPALIDIAVRNGAQAVHPGYGFLSENAGFAQACAEAGLKFVGPSPDVIRTMGDKIAAKTRMKEAGLRVVPGFDEVAGADASTLAPRAEEIGYPVLVKVAAGGGGKGMRVVENAAGLAAAVEAARREASAAFGDARIFLEKYLARARHVEFQILGDEHGHVVHLFERECSIQRRHQKIIEEAPAPSLNATLRQGMGEAAVRAAETVGYIGAGTVEFLVDEDDDFYFLEINTRLQVEHPVTELTVRQDLVHLQMHVAAGERLPFTQADLTQSGHAIECRVYAEDPVRDFLPSTGEITAYVPPAGPGIRVDSGIACGSRVTVHYDPQLAKLIVWGATRADAIARMRSALERFVVLGVTTNIDFLQGVLAEPAFVAGDVHTRILEEPGFGRRATELPIEAAIIAALVTDAGPGVGLGVGAAATGASVPTTDPWQQAGAWRPSR